MERKREREKDREKDRKKERKKRMKERKDKEKRKRERKREREERNFGTACLCLAPLCKGMLKLGIKLHPAQKVLPKHNLVKYSTQNSD